MFFYSDTEKFTGSIPQGLDPNSCWNKHNENYFFLKFIIDTSDNLLEKHQAKKELLICERKMKFWSSRHGFDHKKAQDENIKLKKKWKQA